MDIQEAARLKREVERDITRLIHDRVEQFTRDTGLSPWAIEVSMLEHNAIGSGGVDHYNVSQVDMSVSL